ncbi:hypothetical protein HK101_003081, partial [Irineochytrium annulatum]
SDVEDDMEIVVPQPYHGAEHIESTDEEPEDEDDDGGDGEHVEDPMAWNDDFPHEDENPENEGEEDHHEEMDMLHHGEGEEVDEEDGEEDDEEDEDDIGDDGENENEGSDEDILAPALADALYGDDLNEGEQDDFGILGPRSRNPFIPRRNRRGGRRHLMEFEFGANGLDVLLDGDVRPADTRNLPEFGMDYPMEARGNNLGAPMRIELPIPAFANGGLVGGVPVLNVPPARYPTGSASTGAEASGAAPAYDEQLRGLHSAIPMSNADRWTQEARLIYGPTLADQGVKTVNVILNALVPIAIEEAKRKELEEAAKKAKELAEKAEVDRKKKEEDDARKVKEAEEAAAAAAAAAAKAAEDQAAAAALGSASVDVGMTDAPQGADNLAVTDDSAAADLHETDVGMTEASEVSVAPSTSVIADASSASGAIPSSSPQPMDTAEGPSAGPSTAVAAPERIVVTINGQEVDITGSGIDPEFINALPDELRREVLREHMREQRQRTAAAAPARPAAVPADMSDFLEALPQEIRDEVMSQRASAPASRAVAAEIDPASFLASLDPNLRQVVLMEQEDGFLATLPPALMAEANAALRQATMRRFAIPRHLPSNAIYTGLNAAAASFAATSSVKRPSRDVVQLVEKPALMTLLRLLFVPESANKAVLHRLLLNLSENKKTRSDLIYLLLSILADGSADIVAVDKSFAQLSIKGKGKHSVTPKKPIPQTLVWTGGESIPNLVAQRSLEALAYLVSNNEQIVHFLLSENESFGASMAKARSASKKTKGKEKASTLHYPVIILLGLLERPTFLTNQSLLEQLMHLLSIVLRAVSTMVKKPEADATVVPSTTAAPLDIPDAPLPSGAASGGQTTDGQTPTAIDSSASEQPALKETTSEENHLKPPAIPEANLRSIVNVLKAGECSSKTFQYTLSMIQQMSAVGTYKDVLLAELGESAQALSDSMNEDLVELCSALSTEGPNVDVNSGILGKFSPSSSQQSKLLRILKAIDFILSKDLKSAVAGSTQDRSVPVNLSKAPSVASLIPETVKESLLVTYNKLHFSALWQNLGDLLASIAVKTEMVHIATVILPLIESFMVVSKPYVMSSGFRPAVATSIGRAQKELKSLPSDEMFYTFTEHHRKILNAMVRNNPSLMSGSFSLLVLNARILEFDNKRTFFNQQLHKRTAAREHYGSLPINIRRAHVFEDSYHQLHGRTGDEIKYGKLAVRFHEEEGIDAGGVTREWFSVLARQMFNPDYALFKPSAVDKVTYQPNRDSWINPEHLSYFRFVGRVIGKAIYDNRLLDCYFTRSFYKAMLDIAVDYKDMEPIDPEFHKSLEWMLNNDITDVLDLTFSTEIDEFGRSKILDLKPNGRNIPVTQENKLEYVKLIVEQKLVSAIKEQIDEFLKGFHEIIPKDLIKIFNEQELELLISGLPDIDIDDWKNNTVYENYTASSPVVQWFWRAVRSFSQEERAKLLQFVTGTSKVPLEGFKALEGSNGVQPFQIHKDFSSTTRLPSAHTCFNQVDIPEYESYEQLRANVLLAISECGT